MRKQRPDADSSVHRLPGTLQDRAARQKLFGQRDGIRWGNRADPGSKDAIGSGLICATTPAGGVLKTSKL